MSASKSPILSTLRNAIALVWGLAIFGVIAWYLLSSAPEPAVDVPVAAAPAVGAPLAEVPVVEAPAAPVAANPEVPVADAGTTIIEAEAEIAMIKADPAAYVEQKTTRILARLIALPMPDDQKAHVEATIRIKALAYAQGFFKYGTREREPLDTELARLRGSVDLAGKEISGWACVLDNVPAPLTADYFAGRFKQRAETGLPHDPGELYCNATVMDPEKERLRRVAEQALADQKKAPEHEINPGIRIRAVLAEPVATAIDRIYNNDVLALGGKVIASLDQSQETFGLENAILAAPAAP
jgi:hypothetical protein